MLETIGKIFGQTTLQVVIAVTGVYYGLLALARVRELFFGGDGARTAAAQKAHLEVLKLEAEIAETRKRAGLEPLSLGDLTPAAISKPVPLLTRFATFLWLRGPLAKLLFVAMTITFQLLGWLAMSVLVLAGRYWITMRLQDPQFHLKSIEVNVLVVAVLLGGGSLYLGFVAFGQKLKDRLGRLYHFLCAIVFVLVLGISVIGWVKQTVQPTAQETSQDQ